MKGEQEFLTLYNNRFIEAMSRLKNYGESTENKDAFRDGIKVDPKT